MPHSDHAIQCRCGQVRGLLASTAPAVRLVCYCRDCQAYAHALPRGAQVLDEHGGTQIVATLQQHLRFTQGEELLACLSLSERGLLRWHARCCGTPIGNTARDPKMSYVGLVHSCLVPPGTTLDADFGAACLPTSTERAKGTVAKAGTLAMVRGISRIFAPVIRARLNGSWKRSPLYRDDAQGRQPVVAPRVLDASELARARAAVDAA